MLIASHGGPADLQTVSRFRELLGRDQLGIHVAESVLDDLALAVSELAANSVLHARPQPQRLEIEVHLEGTSLRVVLRDDGPPFAEFESRWAESRNAPMDPMAEGGRGLWLIRNAVDRLVYEPGGGNRWTLWRSFGASEKPAILLVEDDSATRSLYVSLLSSVAQISCVGSVAEARDVLADTAFDLVIADYSLGDGSSAELLEMPASASVNGDVPFIFVTSDTSGQARATALRHGVHMVIEKPVRPKELRAHACEAIAAHRAHAARASARLAREVEQRIALRDPVEIGGVRLVARAASASIGGGDLFADLGSHGDHRRFALADCAGHGLPARLQAALVSGLMAGLAPAEPGRPDLFLEAVSAAIFRGGVLDGLVTTVMALDIASDGGLALATAGHPCPLWLAPDGSAEPVPVSGALPGLMPACGAMIARLSLAAGERLLLATDGVAPDSGEELSGIPEGVARVLANLHELELGAAADALEAAIQDQFGPYPADDWTFVLVEASPRQPARA